METIFDHNVTDEELVLLLGAAPEDAFSTLV